MSEPLAKIDVAQIPASEAHTAGSTTGQHDVKNTPPNAHPKVPRELLAFMPDSVELDQGVVPRPARWVLYTIMALLVTIVVWASLSKVDRVVVARGQLGTTLSRLLVQPLSTGIIREILVEPGDVVSKGQALATLDATFAKADYEEASQQIAGLRSQLRRMRAELSDEDYRPQSDEDSAIARVQRQLFERRRSEAAARTEQLKKQGAGIQAAIQTNTQQRHLLSKRLKLIREIELLNEKLLRSSSVSKVQYLQAKDGRLEIENSLGRLRNENEELKLKLDSAKAEQQAFYSARQRETTESLVDAETRFQSLRQQMEKAQRMQSLVVLKAPADGVVLEIMDRSVGSVIQTAEPLLTLVPTGGELVAEVMIPAMDIARIRRGDEVIVKLDAFPFQRHGTLEGRVETISEDAFKQEGQQGGGPSVYRAKVRLVTTQLEEVTTGFRLLPGMDVSAEIKIGSRRIVSYLIYPVIRASGESLREP